MVKGIKSDPRARARVPASLAHYLTDTLLLSAWYPESDYHALIALLASTVDAKAVGGDVWGFFGRTAAQRDVGGDQASVPERSRVGSAGLYRSFGAVDAHDIAGLFLRVSKMWSLYHDTGRLLYARHPERKDAVAVRIVDFHFPVRGLVDLQAAYMIEYGRLSGIDLEGALVRFTSDPNGGCEWHYRVESDEENLRSIAKLPLFT